MLVEVKKLDKVKRQIKVTVEGEKFLKEKKDSYLQTGKSLKVSGFRAGNVPLDILEKQYGDILKEEFLKNKLADYYQQAIEEVKLSPVILPKIFDIKLIKESLVFCAEFDVKPEIDLKDSDYKGLKIKEKSVKVSDDEVITVWNNLKESVKKIFPIDLEDTRVCKWAGYQDLEGLKEAVSAEIFMEKIRQRRQKINNQITGQLLKNVKVDVSLEEVNQHHKQLLEREIYSLRMRGISEDDIVKYQKDIEEKLKTAAEDEVKLIYILGAVADKEKLKVENNLGEVVLGFILSEAVYDY